MKKILVYDDEKGRGQVWADRLKELEIVVSEFDVKTIDDATFRREMNILLERQKKVRSGEKWSDQTLRLDEASMLLVDYDLLRSSDPSSFLTGEVVAYLTRCYSTCSLIAGLNQFGDKTFDLTLQGHPDSFADINIGSAQHYNLGLWGGRVEGFRPWCWPVLPDLLESFQARTKDVREHLNEPIQETLGIQDVMRTLPRSASGFVGSEPVSTTFRQFVEDSGNGLRGRDRKANDEMVARIAAARIWKWLERVILPGQDILVDAPHLVSRFPSLLKGNISDLRTWNAVAGFVRAGDLDLDHEKIDEFRFKKEPWLSRPCWFWGKISESQKIKEVAEPWERVAVDYVFCEDTSSFCRREECREFIAGVDSPYVRRFVRYLPDKADYRPKVRLLE